MGHFYLSSHLTALALLKKNVSLSAAVLGVMNSVGLSAMAQVNASETRVRKSFSQEGFFVGFEYMNLTDIHIKSEGSSSSTDKDGNVYSESRSDSSVAGTHMGLAGISLGYNSTPESGVGFIIGLRLMESFVRSEWGDQKLGIVMPEASLSFAFGKYAYSYAGLNVGKFSNSSGYNDFKPQIGAQIGLGLRFTPYLALNAGYTMIRQELNNSYTYSSSSGTVRGESKAEFQISGFSSGLSYTV